MAVVKNKTTERGREFWSHVESIASQVRSSEQVCLKRSTGDGSFQSAGSGSNENVLNCSSESDDAEGSSRK
jgi:hypothetical protein